MKSSHKIFAVVLVALGLLVAGAVTTYRSGRASPEVTFQRVSDRLGCKCGCNQPLTACTHHPCGSADPMREQIRAGVAAGKDEEAIIREFVAQNGAVILAAPPAEGAKALAAWIMPFLALLLGTYFVYRIVKNWRSRPAPAAAAPDPKRTALLDKYAAAIDEELEHEP